VLFVEIEPALAAVEGAPGGRRLSRSTAFTASRFKSAPALRQHVGIAAGIFDPAPSALRRDHGSDDPIEEIAAWLIRITVPS